MSCAMGVMWQCQCESYWVVHLYMPAYTKHLPSIPLGKLVYILKLKEKESIICIRVEGGGGNSLWEPPPPPLPPWNPDSSLKYLQHTDCKLHFVWLHSSLKPLTQPPCYSLRPAQMPSLGIHSHCAYLKFHALCPHKVGYHRGTHVVL